MFPTPTLPATWQGLLAEFRRCFSSSTFPVFCALTTGLVACTRLRTVTGMLIGAGMNLAWRHEKAHRFFSRAVWCIDHVGLVLARLVVAMLVEVDAPLIIAIDDSVTRRSGKQVHGAFWQYDGSATGTTKTSRGNCFVVAGVVVHLPFLPRAVCLPVLARLYVKDGPGKVAIAAELCGLLASVFPDRRIHVVADAAYHGKPLRELPGAVWWTLPHPAQRGPVRAPTRPECGRQAARPAADERGSAGSSRRTGRHPLLEDPSAAVVRQGAAGACQRADLPVVRLCRTPGDPLLVEVEHRTGVP
jgi:hypothetical protein